MQKEFVPYELAVKLKALGFNEPCFGLYAPPSKTVFLHHYGLLSAKEQILAPLYQQAFRWIRDKYFIHHEIGRDYDTWDYELYDFKSGNKHIPTGFKTFGTYEEAELACLEKLIEITETP